MARRAYYFAHAIAVIKNYPMHKRNLEELKSSSPPTDGIRSKNKISKPTETLALMQLPPSQQREYDAVAKAIEITKQMKTGETRLKLIDILYWSQRGNISYASIQLFYSERQLMEYRRDFIKIVAKAMGWID